MKAGAGASLARLGGRFESVAEFAEEMSLTVRCRPNPGLGDGSPMISGGKLTVKEPALRRAGNVRQRRRIQWWVMNLLGKFSLIQKT